MSMRSELGPPPRWQPPVRAPCRRSDTHRDRSGAPAGASGMCRLQLRLVRAALPAPRLRWVLLRRPETGPARPQISSGSRHCRNDRRSRGGRSGTVSRVESASCRTPSHGRCPCTRIRFRGYVPSASSCMKIGTSPCGGRHVLARTAANVGAPAARRRFRREGGSRQPVRPADRLRRSRVRRCIPGALTPRKRKLAPTVVVQRGFGHFYQEENIAAVGCCFLKSSSRQRSSIASETGGDLCGHVPGIYPDSRIRSPRGTVTSSIRPGPNGRDATRPRWRPPGRYGPDAR